MVSLSAAVIPLIILLHSTVNRTCELWLESLIQHLVTWCFNVCGSLNIALYALNALLCVCVFRQIRAVRREMMDYQFKQSLRMERRALLTIITLLATLLIFFVPYMIVHLISLNIHSDSLIDNTLVIYYMNMLPYIKYALDPIIYGLRMREINACRRGSRRRDRTSPPTNQAVDFQMTAIVRPSIVSSSDPTIIVALHHMSSLDGGEYQRCSVNV